MVSSFRKKLVVELMGDHHTKQCMCCQSHALYGDVKVSIGNGGSFVAGTVPLHGPHKK